MNPISKEYGRKRRLLRSEVIEIGAVALDEDLKELGTFKIYVKPQFNNRVMPDIRKLTGIGTGFLWGAADFGMAMSMLFDWCDSLNDEICFCEWSDNDLCQVQKEMLVKGYNPARRHIAYLSNWRDIQKEYDTVFERGKASRLKTALLELGIDAEGRLHDAYYDARNTAEIMRFLSDPEKVEEHKRIIAEVLEPEEHICTIGDMFDLSVFACTA